MTPRGAARSRPLRRGAVAWVPLLAVLSGLAALLGSVHAPAPGSQLAPPTKVPVDHRVLVCPTETFHDSTDTSTTLVSSPFEGQEKGGSVTAGQGRQQPVAVTRRRPVVLPQSSSSGTVVVGDGPAAQGLQAVRSDTGKLSAAVVDCVEPAPDWWFVGAGASVARTSELLLRNVDDGDATVHIRVFAPGGEIDAGTVADVVVPSGGRRRIDVSLLAPFHDTLAVWVHADRGRVAAAMLNTVRTKALKQPARGWLSGQSSPSRNSRLVGSFRLAERAKLLVANPGSRETLVQFEVAGKNGWYEVPELPPVTVGPGEVVSAELDKNVRTSASAIRITATRPVVASARLASGSDVAFAEEAPTWGRTAVGVVAKARSATVTVLGGGQETSSVDVVALDARGRKLRTRSVDVAPGATVSTRLPDRTVLVSVQPRGGTFSAAVTTSGPGLTVLPLHGLVVSVAQPSVMPFSE